MAANKTRRAKKHLQQRLKAIHKTTAKYVPEPTFIKVNHISLGDLRRKYSNKHVSIADDPERMDTSKFKRCPPNSTQPLEIRGSDNGLLLYRFPAGSPELAQTLHETITRLPPTKKRKHKGLKRSTYTSRHYNLTCNSADEPYYTREYKDDGPLAEEFIEFNKPMWKRMAFVLGMKAPNLFRDVQLFDIPQQWLCGAFSGCVINQGGLDVEKTTPHRDPREPRESYAALTCTGVHSDGGLILHDLHIIVEINPGDTILFPDSIIYHSNKEVQGERNSVVCYTENNMYAYWKRKFGMKQREIKLKN